MMPVNLCSRNRRLFANAHEPKRRRSLLLQAAQSRGASLTERLPPHAYFIVSALFHYLGPSFAVLLFAHIGVLGVAWLRIARAALIFALWRRPWRLFAILLPERR